MIMQQEQVKSGGKVVATASWEKWDSVGEALAKMGEATTLEKLNRQCGTDAKNAARQTATRKPGRETLWKKAACSLDYNKVLAIHTDPSMAGDTARIEEAVRRLIDERIAELEAEAEVQAPA